ncbi:U-box domain-containing protein 9-like [Phragmites australis]|uniref:U-box domain-containing protein 9-like n=1 Tax=Phragmites australis TaxID=29695 RepID=UPI002D78A48F|nr:U-box domain-containing protein 9-like [Phragmites australis]
MATRLASSVRTTRRAPRLSGGNDVPEASGEAGAAEQILASLREWRATLRLLAPRDDAAGGSASVGGGGAEDEEEEGGVESFSFPQLQTPPTVEEGEKVEVQEGGVRSFSFPHLQTPPIVDGAEVLDAFTSTEEAREAKAAAEFLEAIMGANTGPRTEAIKKELFVNRRVLDLAGLERWLRRAEAVAELAWFVDLCYDEDNSAPSLDLFECAFRALEGASSSELHRGPDARRRWIGSVPVPEFFFCPVSKKIMEQPVVISSGKTVDLSALEKWWKENERICPVTGEILAHTVFIRNILITLCISWWGAANSITDVTAVTDPPAISPQEEARFKQVTLMAHSPRCSKEARDALFLFHELIDKESSFVHLLGRHPGAIAKLASVLPETCLEPDPELDDIILGIMAKAASYGPNKAAFGDDQYAIPVLIARAWLGPVPTRAKCAEILGLLADNYYNKIKIGELGGFAALIELLLVGDMDVKKTTAWALASLCEAHENWSRFVREGVADAAISLLRNDGLVVETQAILLQARGFELAMTQILEKLQELGGEEMCEKMRNRLWHSFMMTERRRRSADVPSASYSAKASDTSSWSPSEAGVEGSADHEQTKKDVKAIVSWLQKKCYYPWTYRYRD